MSASGEQSPEAVAPRHPSSQQLANSDRTFQPGITSKSSHDAELQDGSPTVGQTAQLGSSSETSKRNANPMSSGENEEDRPSLADSGNAEVPSSSSASTSSAQSPGSSELFDASQPLRFDTPPSSVSPQPSEVSNQQSDQAATSCESPEPFLGTIAWPTSVSTFSTVRFPSYVSTTGPSEAYTGPAPVPLPTTEQINSSSTSYKSSSALAHEIQSEVEPTPSRLGSDTTLSGSSSATTIPANPLGSTFARDALLKYAHAIYHQISKWDGSSSPPQPVLAAAQMPFFMPMLLSLMRAQIPDLGTVDDVMDVDERPGSTASLTLKRQILFRQRLLPLMLQLRHLHPSVSRSSLNKLHALILIP